MATAAETLATKINREMGEGTIRTGADLGEQDEVSYLSTGSLVYDVMLGGGFVRNQWNEVVGLESSGKTVMILKCVAANQRRDPKFKVLWIAAEDLDPDWVRTLGVDIDRVFIVSSNLMEECFEICLTFVKEQAIDMVVIDSLPALVTEAEEEKDMDEFVVAAGARMIGKFFRKATFAMKHFGNGVVRPCTGIVVNQWRDRIGVVRGDPRTTPGGKAKNYFFWTRTELSRTEWITAKGGAKEKIGQTIKAKTFKNKSAPVQREAEIDFYFDDTDGFEAGQYDTLKEVVNTALAFAVIERHGKYYDFRGERVASGREGLYENIRNDEKLVTQISDDVMSLVRGEEPSVLPAPPPARRGIKRRSG
jgi:recombination protein RecA